jgi:DDE superfamily endonuclease
MDEHRIGLKPVQRRVWAPIGQRPVATVQHRFAWRYVVGFVPPASGRTVVHLATSVNIPLFEAELAAFARAAGASPTKQIVLVLDQAGWHTSLRLRVPPDHVHLLFLPPLYRKVLTNLPAGIRVAEACATPAGCWAKAVPPVRCDRFE